MGHPYLSRMSFKTIGENRYITQNGGIVLNQQEGWKDTEEPAFWGEFIVSDILCLRMMITNVCMVGDPEHPHQWVLVDTGLWNSADGILEAAAERFGEDNKPQSIILTHGHFDHVGSIQELLERWEDVPAYAIL